MQYERGKLNMVVIDEPYIRVNKEIGQKVSRGSVIVHAQHIADITGESFEWDGSKLTIGGEEFDYVLVNKSPWVGIREFSDKCRYGIYLYEYPLSAFIRPLPEKSHVVQLSSPDINSVREELGYVADRITKTGYRENNEMPINAYGPQNIHVIVAEDVDGYNIRFSTLTDPITGVRWTVVKSNPNYDGIIKISTPLYYGHKTWPEKCNITVQLTDGNGHDMYMDFIGCTIISQSVDGDVNKVLIGSGATYKVKSINGPFDGQAQLFKVAKKGVSNYRYTGKEDGH